MRVCVFCGSKSGRDPAFRTFAEAVGRGLARAGCGVVYGGGHVGLMGAVADGALAEGGEVTGVIPHALADRELAHKGLTALELVDSMHTRKARMAELSDAFLALPGGAGTLEEIFEQWTWAQLGLHAKPLGFINHKGFYDPLREMIGRMTAEGFLSGDHADMVIFADDVDAALAAIRAYQPPEAKWGADGVGIRP